MGIPLPPSPPPPPPPPPPTLPLLAKTLTLSSLVFWLTVVFGLVVFIFAAFAFSWALHLLVSEWSSFSRLGKVANTLFFVGVALLLLAALVGFITAIIAGVSLGWK
jgi:hypothetical protein